MRAAAVTPPLPGAANPHKPGTKRAAQWNARQAKAEAKATHGRLLAAAVEAGRAEAKKPPAAIGEWGVVRTRAWAEMASRLARQVELQRPGLAKVEALRNSLREIASGRTSIAMCAKIAERQDIGGGQ